MILKTWSSLIFALLLALVLPVSGLANQLLDGRVIIGEDFTLHSGEIFSFTTCSMRTEQVHNPC